MTGLGDLQSNNKKCYKGQFVDGKLHGEGVFSVQGGSYSLGGKFTNGVPEFQANKYLLDVISPIEEEEDPKAKKDPKKAAAQIEEPEGGNAIKISLDTANPDEARRALSLSLTVVFQGEAYEDPNPPEEDEAAKKKKGGKDASAEPEVRMITPEPINLETESGRQFEIQLGRHEQVPVETSEKPVSEAAEGEQTHEEEVATVEKWIQYKFDQSKEELTAILDTQEGKLLIENIQYQLSETFQSGNYEVVIKDITNGILEEDKLETMRLDLKVFDSEVEAEQAAAHAAAGGKKKK